MTFSISLWMDLKGTILPETTHFSRGAMVAIQVSAAVAKVLTRMAPKHEAGERGRSLGSGGVPDASLTGIYKG